MDSRLLHTERVTDRVGERGATRAEQRPRPGATLAVLAMSLGLFALPPSIAILILLGVVS